MRTHRSLCLHCLNLTRNPASSALHCALGRRIITLSVPNLCRRYEPVLKPKPDPTANSQLHLFPA